MRGEVSNIVPETAVLKDSDEILPKRLPKMEEEESVHGKKRKSKKQDKSEESPLKIELESAIVHPQIKMETNSSDSSKDDAKTNSMLMSFKGADPSQLKTVREYLEGLEEVYREIVKPAYKDPKKDEDLVHVILQKELVTRYFSSQGADPPELVGGIMRSKVTISDMVSFLSRVRFKDKHSDMILVMLKQMNDILLELVMNSSTGSMNIAGIEKNNVSLVNMFVFFIKNFFQQVKIMKGVFTNESHAALDANSFLFNMDYMPTVRMLVKCSVDLTPPEAPKSNHSAHSAFQFHSQKAHENQGFQLSILNIEQQPNPAAHARSQEFSGNFLDRTYFEMQKSNQLKLPSFNFPGSLRSDAGAVDIHQELQESGKDMNRFISNILGKK